MTRALRRLWALLTRRRVEADLDDELRFHLEMETARNVRHGMDDAAAETAARRDLGGIERTKDDVREARGLDRVDAVWRDVRLAARSLARSPALLVAVTLTLGLGIGATTAIFSVVHAVLLEQLPWPDAGRLVVPQSMRRGQSAYGTVTYRDFVGWQADSVFQKVALYQMPEFDLAGDQDAPVRMRLAHITRDFFDVLGVKPLLGRLPFPEEYTPATERPLVLSYGLWQRMGGRADIVGTKLRMTSLPVTIVGVLPRGAGWPQNADAWYPQRGQPGESWMTEDNFMFWGVARLKPGAALEETRSRLDLLARGVEAQFPAKRKDITYTATPLRNDLVGDTLTRALWLLLGGIAFVLLIACANIANLLLARAAARQRELAVRIALGASRRRLVRQMVIESLVLTLPGGAFGLLVAHGTLRAITALAPANLPRLEQVGLHPVVLSVAAGVTLLVAFLLGLVPALQASAGAAPPACARGTWRHRSWSPRSRCRSPCWPAPGCSCKAWRA